MAKPYSEMTPAERTADRIAKNRLIEQRATSASPAAKARETGSGQRLNSVTHSQLETSFDKNGNLRVKAKMSADQRVFQSGNRGYRFTDRFPWDGRWWRITFSAYVKPQAPETTLGLIPEAGVKRNAPIRPASPTIANTEQELAAATKLELLRRWSEARAERSAAGWQLTKVQDGIEGWFQMEHVRPMPNGKMGSFASFTTNFSSIPYWGTFHISEIRESMPKPTAWDNTRGAKAGLPSLGKRR